jgi:hypothetical protein
MPLVHNQPIVPRGGPRLRRAALAAFNRVPGRIGRFNVTLISNLALLTEIRERGEVPLLAVGPECAAFLPVPGTFRAFRQGRDDPRNPIGLEEMLEGYPFNRMAALWAMLNEGAARLVLWNRDMIGPSLSGTEYLIGVRPLSQRLYTGFTPINLCPSFRATFYGSRVAGRTGISEMQNLFNRVESWTQLGVFASSRWATMFAPLGRTNDGASTTDALAGIGPEPQLWSSDTDPGGEGDPAGEDDGESNRDDGEPEFDEDGDEVPRPRRRAPRTPMPGIPRASFREWEQAVPSLNEEAEIRARDLSALRRQVIDRNIARIRDLMEAQDARAPCSHCEGGGCETCARLGSCMNCGRTLGSLEETRVVTVGRWVAAT